MLWSGLTKVLDRLTRCAVSPPLSPPPIGTCMHFSLWLVTVIHISFILMIYFLFLQVSLLCIKISKSYNPTIFRTPANRFGLRIVTHLTDRYINDKKGSHSRRWHSCSGKVQIFFSGYSNGKALMQFACKSEIEQSSTHSQFSLFFSARGGF